MTENRKDCPMRHENGNCTVSGGFCTAVNDPICEALHNAFDCGYRSALRQQGPNDWICTLKCTALMDEGMCSHGGLCCLCESQRTIKKNQPLTMDELRQMAQKCEGIYVAHIDGTPVFRGQKYCAAALDFSPAFGSSALHVHAIYGDRLTLWEDDYGKNWLAYRQKPEEDECEH